MIMDMMMAAANPTSSLSSYYAKNQNRTLKTQQSLVSYSPCNHPIVIPSSLFKIRNNRSSDNKLTTFCRLQAQGKYRSASPDLMEMTDFDDFDDDENYDDDDDDEEEEGEELMPLGKMKKWLENKPPGFGEGKVYETRIEDKLLEEIEQSRLAQAANINNLKNSSAAAARAPKKTAPNQTNKAPEVIPTGFRVLIINLPKKKNIHRDLKLAFKDVHGILNIIPAVSGNKKTKAPICKGSAFVDFKSKEDAASFVQQFSRQSIAFGKIQKQIKCEMKNSSSSSSFEDESVGSFSSDLPLTVSGKEGEMNLKMDDSFFEETVSDMSQSDDLEDGVQDITENVESFSIKDSNSYDSSEPRVEPATGSLTSKKQYKNGASNKKIIGKGRGEKASVLDIPGSAKRLKIKEKAVLTDVFNKYGQKAALASAKES